jgi:hypothetical protein
MVWLTAHGAHALLHHPLTFFDAEGCFPGEKTLAYGETGLTLGLAALPVFLLTGDPVASFNSVVLLLSWIAAFSMFLLVREWTASPAAGVVAGLLYGYSEIRAADVVHLNIFDTAWTVLALLFATRIFSRGRWRDAVAFALCIVLQMGASFYTLVSAGLVGVPVAIWLVVSHGIRMLRPAQLLGVAAVALGAMAVLFAPYLAFEQSGDLKQQGHQYYAALSFLLPGSPGFFGWATILLAAVALFSPRGRLALRGGRDPRWALLAGSALVLLFSIGAIHNVGFVLIESGSGIATPYQLLARIVPGLDVIRSPVALMPAAHIGICALAGLGAAAVLARVPARMQTHAAAALVLVAAIETIRPAFLGLTPRVVYAPIRTAPDARTLALYREAAELGNRGPVLVLPVRPRDLIRASSEIVLAAYHWRRTSACYNFGHFPESLRDLAAQLPAPEAIRALSDMGFTTLALHHPASAPNAILLRRRLDMAARAEKGDRLQRVVGDDALSLYALVPGES